MKKNIDLSQYYTSKKIAFHHIGLHGADFTSEGKLWSMMRLRSVRQMLGHLQVRSVWDTVKAIGTE